MTDHVSAVARALALPDVAAPHDLAAHLGLSPRTVRRYLANGVLPGRRIGRRWFTVRDDLLAALRARPVLRLAGEVSR